MRTEIDNLRVVVSVEGSMEYQRLYQEVQAQFVSEDSLVFKVADLITRYVQFTLVGDESALPKEDYQLPSHQQLQNIFLPQLRDIKQRAEQNLGQRVEISAISLPSYWFDDLKNAVHEAATQLDMVISRDMLLGHEETARLAYNLGDRKRQGTWFLVLVEYNTRDLYLTFTEMNDLDDPEEHPQYPVDGKYLLEHLGEDSLIRARSYAEHYTNIKKAFDQFLLNHVAKDPDNIDESRDQTLWEFPYSDIKGVILTGDASEGGMRAMGKILREVFADLPQCASGNIFTELRPSHVVALGTARAVRSNMVNGSVLSDVYELVAIED